MSFELKKPFREGSIAFSPIFCAPGTRGFFLEGYPWHNVAKLLGLTFKGTSFVAKTATLKPLAGNMPLKSDGLTPKEWKPKCVETYFASGHMLNAVGLSNAGFWKLFFDGRWQSLSEPFMLSFMPKGERLEEKLSECRGLVHDFLYQYYDRPCGCFASEFAMQINFACPNTGTDPSAFLSEVNAMLEAFAPLREAGIPLVANFNALVPLKVLFEAEKFCDAFWIGNTVPWGTTGIDWSLFAKGKGKQSWESPLRKRGIPADGGLSGPLCFQFTFDKVYEATESGIRLPIIAGNGVQTPKDVDLLRLAGASAVAVGTVALMRPWRMRAIINRALETFSDPLTDVRKTGGKRPAIENPVKIPYPTQLTEAS